MKKFYLIADLTVYAEVEAENEDQAWQKGKELPIDAWELNTEVGDIWSIDESFDDENGEICEEESRIEDEQEYGPSNPWDAPGMSVSDFIRGVH